MVSPATDEVLSFNSIHFCGMQITEEALEINLEPLLLLYIYI